MANKTTDKIGNRMVENLAKVTPAKPPEQYSLWRVDRCLDTDNPVWISVTNDDPQT